MKTFLILLFLFSTPAHSFVNPFTGKKTNYDFFTNKNINEILLKCKGKLVTYEGNANRKTGHNKITFFVSILKKDYVIITIKKDISFKVSLKPAGMYPETDFSVDVKEDYKKISVFQSTTKKNFLGSNVRGKYENIKIIKKTLEISFSVQSWDRLTKGEPKDTDNFLIRLEAGTCEVA